MSCFAKSNSDYVSSRGKRQKVWADYVPKNGEAPSLDGLRDSEVLTRGEQRQERMQQKIKIYAGTKRQSEPG